MKILYQNRELQEKITELAERISADYKDRPFLAVGLLKGCVVFMSHLLVQIKGEVEIDFMTISSYKHGTQSDDFKFIQDLDTDVRGRDVLIVEDIIDTGKTMSFVQKYLESRGAASVETVTLVDKGQRRKHKIKPPKYVGFKYNEAPFIVGFGFDHSGLYRNLPDVYMLEQSDIAKKKQIR